MPPGRQQSAGHRPAGCDAWMNSPAAYRISIVERRHEHGRIRLVLDRVWEIGRISREVGHQWHGMLAPALLIVRIEGLVSIQREVFPYAVVEDEAVLVHAFGPLRLRAVHPEHLEQAGADTGVF